MLFCKSLVQKLAALNEDQREWAQIEILQVLRKARIPAMQNAPLQSSTVHNAPLQSPTVQNAPLQSPPLQNSPLQNHATPQMPQYRQYTQASDNQHSYQPVYHNL